MSWPHFILRGESRFCMDFNNGHRQVWKQAGQRSGDSATVEHDIYGGGSVMIWAGIHIDIHVFRTRTVKCPEVFRRCRQVPRYTLNETAL